MALVVMISIFMGEDSSREFFPQECTMTTPKPLSYEIGLYARRFHLLFRVANGSWISASLEHTTLNTPPQ